MMKQKIFLTGSTSFLGTKFIEIYGDKFDIYGIATNDPVHPLDMLDVAALKQDFDTFQPDVVIHTAAIVDQTAVASNAIILKNILDLAIASKTPFIYTSSEAVYGGKEQTGEYAETDEYKPRNPYGQSKVESEKLVISSGLPYLITRGHRYVGISKTFSKPKQFPDTLKALLAGLEVHLDSSKLFKPVLINNLCDIFAHYIEHDTDKQILINVGVDKPTTYYDFIKDVAKTLSIDVNLIKPDGEETGWPQNSTLCLEKMQGLGYPTVIYDQMLEIIKSDSEEE